MRAAAAVAALDCFSIRIPVGGENSPQLLPCTAVIAMVTAILCVCWYIHEALVKTV